MSNEEFKNGNNGDQENNGETAQKTGIKKALDHVQRGWLRFSTSKGGRWAIRTSKAALIGFGMYKAYDMGKKSVKPQMILVEPAESEPEVEPETQAETEPVVDETVSE